MGENKYANITNPLNFKAKVSIDQGIFGEPIRIKSVGGRRWFMTVCVILIVLQLANINIHIGEANRLKEEDIKLKKERLDLARRQFALDSIIVSQKLKTK